jgi:phage terminase large subunit GpA-like protein
MYTDTTLSVLQFPVQVGKSLILKLLALYNIVTDPSPILFLADTSANSEDFCDTSLTPMIKQNQVFNGLISTSAGANMKETKIFTNGAILWNRGASNLKNLQRRSVKLLLADECWLYPQGHIEEAVKRTTRFIGDGGRAVLVSQAGEVDGEFNNYYEQTNQQEFTWKCPCCGNYNPYGLDMVKWDTEAVTEEGNIDYEAVQNSLVYTCKHCSSEWLSTREQLQ